MSDRSRGSCENWLAASIPSALSLFLGHSALAETNSTTNRLTTSGGKTLLDGHASPLDAGISVQSGVQVLLEGSVEYHISNGVCTFTSSGSYSAASNPDHGMLSYGILDHTVQSSDACNGQTFPYAVVYYTWTDNQSGATQDSFSVEWKTPDGMVGGPYGYGVQLSQMPGIAFNGENITSTTQTVVVGQQISLTGSPVSPASSSDVWNVQGPSLSSNNPVGGFTITPGAEPDRPTSGQIAPLNFVMSPTTFYFTVPGTYTVTYAPSGSSSTASADFSVGAPDIVFNTGSPGKVGVSLFYNKDHTSDLRFACGMQGSLRCINFSVDQTSLAGTLLWAQTVQLDSEQKKLPGSGRLYTCTTPPGLDSYYPLNSHSGLVCRPGETACIADVPSSPLEGLRYFERNFQATMYLLWNPGTPNAIDVPLGSVLWSWQAATSLKDGDWTQPAGVHQHPTISSFETNSGFPTWTRVLVNGQDCPFK